MQDFLFIPIYHREKRVFILIRISDISTILETNKKKCFITMKDKRKYNVADSIANIYNTISKEKVDA